MAQSALEVCKSALYKIGAGTITALADSVKEAQICNQRVEICRTNLLRMHPWNFAIKRKILSATLNTIAGISDNGGLFQINFTSHGLVTDDAVTIQNVTNYSTANGTWVITKIDDDNFTLQSSTFAGSGAADGTWTQAAPFDYTYSLALPTDNLRILKVNDELSSPQWRIERNRLLTNQTPNRIKYIYDVTDYTQMDVGFYEVLASYIAWDISFFISGDESFRRDLREEFERTLAQYRFADATEDPAEQVEAFDWLDSRLASPATGTVDRSRNHA